MSTQILPSDASVGLIASLLIAVLAAGLAYQLFELVLDAFRRGFGVVDRDTSYRVTALSRELADAKRRLADAERSVAHTQDRLLAADATIVSLRARSSAQDADLRRALDQVRRMRRDTGALPVSAPVEAVAAPAEPSAVVADPTPVLTDLFDRVLPGLVADESEYVRQAIRVHLAQRVTHLHRLVLPYEEIPLILRLPAERVEVFTRDLDQVIRQLAVPAVRAAVADQWLEQPARTELLRRLRVTTGVDPALEPALVTLIGRYPVRDLRRFAQRLHQIRELATAGTVAEVATTRSADLVTAAWHELAGAAPLHVDVRPAMIGGLILRDDLTYQDRSWARVVLAAPAPEGDTDDRAA